MIVFSVAKLSILFLPLCFSQIDVRIHDGFIDFEYNKVMPTNGTLPLKAFTLEISLNDTTNNDYAISKCTMNSFNFFTYLGCFNSNDIFIARTETEDYNTKKIKKQTLVLFRSSRRQAKIVCDLILLRCRGCAKKSCQRGTEVSRYDLVSLNSVCERKNGSFACETVESSMTSKENSTDTTLKISDNAQSELFKSLKWALAFSIIAAVVAAICYFVAYSQKKHSGRVSTADYMSIFDEKEQATLLRDVRPRDVFRDDDPSASISLDMISIGEFSITTEQLPTVEDWNIVNSVYHTAPHCLRDEKLHDEEETNSKQDKGTETENNSSGEQASPHKNDDGSQLITGRNETGKKLRYENGIRDIPTRTEEEQADEVQSNDNTVAQLNGPPEVKPLWQRRAERRRNVSTILRKNSSRREKRKNGKNKERIDSSETQCPNNDFDMLPHENVPEYCNRKDAHTQNVRRESKKNQCPPAYDDYSSTRATQQYGEHYAEVLQFVFPSPKKLGRVTEVRDIPTSTEEEQGEEVQSNDNTVAQLNGPPEVKPLWQRRAERRRNISTILRKNSSRREKRKNGKNKERIDSSETQCPNNDFDMLSHENVPEYCNRKDAHTQNVRRESKKNQCPPVYDDYSSTRATQQHGEHYVEVLQFVFPSPKKLGRVTEVRDIPTSTEEEQEEEVQSNDNTVAQLNGPPEVKPLWQRRAERRRNISTILRKNSSRREKRKNGKNKERIDSSETQCPNNDFDMLPHENVPEYCNRKDAHTQNVRRESKKNQCPPVYDDYSSTRATQQHGEHYVEVLQFVFPSPKKLGRVTEVRDIPTSTEEEQGEEVQSNDNTVAQLNGPPEVKPLWQRRAERRRNVSTILRKNSSRREKRKNGKNKERIDSSETQCPNNDFDMLPHENVPEYCNRKDAHTQNVRRESKKNQCPPAYDDYSSTRTDRTAEDSEDYCTDV